jgi:ABC-2 type transport system permease protein
MTSDSRRAIGLVAMREIRTRIRSKAYLITTGILLAIVVGFSLFFKIVGGDDGDKVGFLADTSALSQPLATAAAATGETIRPSTVPSAAEGERLLREGELDALVIGTADKPEVVVNRSLSGDLQTAFKVLAQRQVLNSEIVRVGGDPVAVNSAVANASVPVRALEPGQEFRGQRIVIGVFAGILVYMALLTYGQTVAQGVVEEKASRIVEILLTTVRPWQLMFGKVLGIGVIGLLQMLIVVGGGVAAGVATGVLSLPAELATGAGVWTLAWFLLGYVMYALLFAATGAMVSRQEDAGSTTGPVMMLLILPYVLAISILPANPDNGLMQIMSLIPFFAPLIMPMREAMGVAPAWEVWLSVGLTVLTIVGLVWLAGRIYGNAVLRAGAKVKLSEALKAA